jgi:hypothetical protein
MEALFDDAAAAVPQKTKRQQPSRTPTASAAESPQENRPGDITPHPHPNCGKPPTPIDRRQ